MTKVKSHELRTKPQKLSADLVALRLQKRNERRLEKTDFSEVVQKRFWDRIQIGAPDECWPWKGQGLFFNKKRFSSAESKQSRRYPNVIVEGVYYVASRLAYFLTYNENIPGFACHRCDNPRCCNPNHIYSGDARTNFDDMVSRKRSKLIQKGARGATTKLTDSETFFIRALHSTGFFTLKQLASKFGVNHTWVAALANDPNKRTNMDEASTRLQQDFFRRVAAMVGAVPKDDHEAAIARLQQTVTKGEVEELLKYKKALQTVLKGSGCLVFLDGRNEHGTHILPGTLGHVDWEEHEKLELAEDPEFTENVFKEAEEAGFKAGDWVWITWSHFPRPIRG